MNYAQGLVTALPETVEEEKANLQGILEEIQKDIDAFIKAEEAVKAAENAQREGNLTQGLIDEAQNLVSTLTKETDAEKANQANLQGRVDALQVQFDEKELATARQAVEDARVAVNTVKELLKGGNEEQEGLLEAVEDAEQKLEQAQELVNKLPETGEKSALQKAFDDILFDYVEEYVTLAEKLITQGTIEQAQIRVKELPQDEKREELTNRLALVQVQVNTINDAIKLVEEIEKTPDVAKLKVARTAVTNVKAISGKENLASSLDSRLDHVEKALLIPKLEDLIGDAKAAVVPTSTNNGADILYGNPWIDSVNQDAFTDAITAATNMLENKEATWQQVDAAIEALKEAKDNYVREMGIGRYTLRDAATTAIIKAESTYKKEDYDAAKELVDLLLSEGATSEDEAAHPDLSNRLQAIDAVIKATAAVEKAEENPTLTNINTAEKLIELIHDKDEAIKIALEQRLAQLTAGEKNRQELLNAIEAAQPHIAKHNQDDQFYTSDSYSVFKEAYDAALVLKEKPENEVTPTEITLTTEALLEAIDNLIEAAGPALKNDNENTTPHGKRTVVLDLHPTIDYPDDKQVTSGGVLGLDIGIVDLGLLSASQISGLADNTKHEVVVEEGTTYSADLTVAIHTILGGQAFDIGIYKEDPTDGNYKQIDVLSGSSGGALGIAKTERFTLDTLEPGKYAFILDLGGGLAVVQVAPFKLVNQVIRDYKNSADGVSAEGELLNDWNLGGKNEGIVSHIKVSAADGNPKELSETGKTTIQGRYGHLVIGRDGVYKYIPANVPTNVGKVETFEYAVTNTHNGETGTAKLQIRIGADTVEWYKDNWEKEVTVVEAKSQEQSTKIEVNNAKNTVTSSDTRTGLAIWYNGTLQSNDIKVQDKASVLTFDVSKNLSAREANIQVTNKDTGAVVYNENKSISSGGQSIKLADLDAGTYRISVKGTSSMGGSTGRLKNIKVTSPAWGQYDVADPSVLRGNIRTIQGNKLGESDSLKTSLSVRGYLVEDGSTATAQTYHKLDKGPKVIAGKYGALTVQENGEYVYKPNANVSVAGQADVFTYKLTHASGIESEATLTFNINPLKDYTDHDDILVGTTGVDEFKGGPGSDTLVYNPLKEDATGGNKHDTWSDFHYGTIATDADADRVDLRLLFEGQRISNLDSYVQVTQTGKSILIQVDRDGPGSTYEFTDLLTLTVDNLPEGKITIEDLINNGQLVVQ